MKTYIVSYHTNNTTDAGITKITRRDGEKMSELARRAKDALDKIFGTGEAVIDAINSLDAIVDLDD